MAQLSFTTQGCISFCVYKMKLINNESIKYIFGITGDYKWSGTVYGCDAVYGRSRNFALLGSVFGTFLLMLSSYCLTLVHLNKERRLLTKAMGLENINCWKHIFTFLLIMLQYLISVCPAACLTWGLTDIELDQGVELGIICLYWGGFATGVLPYVLTNQRIRDAYARFGSDMLVYLRTLLKSVC